MMLSSADTILSPVFSTALIFLSFLNQVSVASGLPPVDTHSNRVTVPAGMMEPST